MNRYRFFFFFEKIMEKPCTHLLQMQTNHCIHYVTQTNYNFSNRKSAYNSMSHCLTHPNQLIYFCRHIIMCDLSDFPWDRIETSTMRSMHPFTVCFSGIVRCVYSTERLSENVWPTQHMTWKWTKIIISSSFALKEWGTLTCLIRNNQLVAYSKLMSALFPILLFLVISYRRKVLSKLFPNWRHSTDIELDARTKCWNEKEINELSSSPSSRSFIWNNCIILSLSPRHYIIL